jgi:hypothetical protein
MSSTSSSHAHPHRGGPTDPVHDEELRRGIIHTRISRRTAWGLCAAFLLVIYATPIIQVIIDQTTRRPCCWICSGARPPART